MNYKNIVGSILLFASLNALSQSNSFAVDQIPDNLKKSANAVIRSYDIEVTLSSSSKMVIKEKRVITILNENGNRNIGAYSYYDNNSKIKDIKVFIYDRFGNEIKKIKKHDFKDQSAVDGQTLYSDSRVKYLSYTPISYPYTVEFISEILNENTAFIPAFYPLDNYFLSSENSSYVIINPSNLNLRIRKKNFDGLNLFVEENNEKLSYKLSSINAVKPEDFSPSFNDIFPSIMVASEEFTYGGVNAKVKDWASLGKWFNDNLLEGRAEVSAKTQNEVKKLVKGIENPIEKARVVYNYMQENTRYISVQVGIGGMQPISAVNVDKVKYGDCKGLTNYTKSLLDIVGVKSYYTRLYASPSDQTDVDKDFVSFGGQTNHVILNIPMENKEDIWLECTSQKMPFGYLGAFTDNRDVIVVTPEGGKIKRTKKYETHENLKITNGICYINPEGNIKASTSIISEGIPYDYKYRLKSDSKRDLVKHYNEEWDYINNLNIVDMEFLNDKNDISFTENVIFNAEKFAVLTRNRMLVNVNILNRQTYIPDRYRNRRLPLKIYRGFTYKDEVEINLPIGYEIELLPNDDFIESKFGQYKRSLEQKNDSTLIFKREFISYEGEFPKEDYSEFRNFYKNITKSDNAKVSLIKL